MTGPMATLDLLLGDGPATFPPDPAEGDLGVLYAHPAPGAGRAVHLRANMVTTLDGAATGGDGRSGSINNDADLRVFGVLRAVADVVLIGSGTLRAEGYGPLSVPGGLAALRSGLGLPAGLPLAVLTSSGDLPARVLRDDGSVLALTGAGCPRLAELRRDLGEGNVVVAGERDVDLAEAMAAMAARGLRRVLCEGGPGVLAQLVAADLVDELCLTQSPLVVGGPAPRVLDASAWLDPARPAAPAHLLHSGGVLLGRWLLRGT